jgi:hypothetical protein
LGLGKVESIPLISRDSISSLLDEYSERFDNAANLLEIFTGSADCGISALPALLPILIHLG